MENNFLIEFSYKEIKDIVMNYYGIDEEEFNIDDFSDEQIKTALLEGSAYNSFYD